MNEWEWQKPVFSGEIEDWPQVVFIFGDDIKYTVKCC
jgi:hypothetical protein